MIGCLILLVEGERVRNFKLNLNESRNHLALAFTPLALKSHLLIMFCGFSFLIQKYYSLCADV